METHVGIFRRRIVELSGKGTVYPSHIKPLVQKCPDDLLPVLWDLTEGLNISEEETRELLTRLEESEESFLKALVVRRKRRILSGKFGSEIDHAHAACFRQLLTYLSMLATRYIDRGKVDLPVARDHLERTLDLALGILQALVDLALEEKLPRDFVEFARNRVRLAAEDWSGATASLKS